MKFLVFLTMAIMLSSLLLIVGHFLPSRSLELEKSSPYECGFDPMKSARLPFSFRFFLVAMLFLMFDLEMALLFPMMPASSKNMSMLLPLSSVFLMMLAAGLAYEWQQGGLEWAE